MKGHYSTVYNNYSLNSMNIVLLTLMVILSSPRLLKQYDFSDSIVIKFSTQKPSQLVYNIEKEITNAKSASIYLYIMSAVYSNVLMLVDLAPITLDINPATLSHLYLTANSTLKKMDFEGALGGDMQIVNLKLPQGFNSTIYIKIFNLDIPEILSSKTFFTRINTYDQPTALCRPCPGVTYQNPNSGSCKCFPCKSDTFGSACQYLIRTMKQSILYKNTFSSVKTLRYRIEKPPEQIKISFKVNNFNPNKIKIYVQHQLQPGDLAGKMNTCYEDGRLDQDVEVTQKYKYFKTEGKNVTITFQSTENIQSTELQFKYQNGQKSRLGLILGLAFGIAGGVALVVILIIYCRRKKRQLRLKQPVQNSLKLSQDQINIYFPLVWGKQVINILKSHPDSSGLQQSFSNISLNEPQSQKTNSSSIVCSVCLTQISQQSKVRVTYCRHIFHGHCLMSWFKKTQNCPYCRQQWNCDTTIQEYDKIRGNKDKFTRRQLIEGILMQKYGKAMVKEEVKVEKPTFFVSLEKNIKVESTSDMSVDFSFNDQNSKKILAQASQKPKHKPRGGKLPKIANQLQRPKSVNPVGDQTGEESAPLSPLRGDR